MFLLVHANGSVEHLPGVAEIRVEDGEVLCFGDHGAIVLRYPQPEILVYGEEAKIAPILALGGNFSPPVEKQILDGSSGRCSAINCHTGATVAFKFENVRGDMTLGLCDAHQPLLDEVERKVVLDGLDLRRLEITQKRAF